MHQQKNQSTDLLSRTDFISDQRIEYKTKRPLLAASAVFERKKIQPTSEHSTEHSGGGSDQRNLFYQYSLLANLKLPLRTFAFAAQTQASHPSHGPLTFSRYEEGESFKSPQLIWQREGLKLSLRRSNAPDSELVFDFERYNDPAPLLTPLTLTSALQCSWMDTTQTAYGSLVAGHSLYALQLRRAEPSEISEGKSDSLTLQISAVKIPRPIERKETQMLSWEDSREFEFIWNTNLHTLEAARTRLPFVGEISISRV